MVRDYDELVRSRELGIPVRGRVARGASDKLVQSLRPQPILAREHHHTGPIFSLAWSADGDLLISSGDDATLKIWSLSQNKCQTLHSGHQAGVSCVRFMPHCGNSKLVSCGADKQVRVLDLQRGAVLPFPTSQNGVRCVEALDSDVILSASDDGRVRRLDVRERAPVRGATQSVVDEYTSRSVLVEQYQEVHGRPGGSRISINCLALDPRDSYTFATGGGDTLVRVYDIRMLRPRSEALRASTQVPWVKCYVPSHLATAPHLGGAATSSPWMRRPTVHVTGLAYSQSGDRLLASYSHEDIYLFSCRKDAQSYEGLLSAISSGPGSSRLHSGALRGMRRPAHRWYLDSDTFLAPPPPPPWAMPPPLPSLVPDSAEPPPPAAAAAGGASRASRLSLPRWLLGGEPPPADGAAAGPSSARSAAAAAAAGGSSSAAHRSSLPPRPPSSGRNSPRPPSQALTRELLGPPSIFPAGPSRGPGTSRSPDTSFRPASPQGTAANGSRGIPLLGSIFSPASHGGLGTAAGGASGAAGGGDNQAGTSSAATLPGLGSSPAGARDAAAAVPRRSTDGQDGGSGGLFSRLLLGRSAVRAPHTTDASNAGPTAGPCGHSNAAALQDGVSDVGDDGGRPAKRRRRDAAGAADAAGPSAAAAGIRGAGPSSAAGPSPTVGVDPRRRSSGGGVGGPLAAARQAVQAVSGWAASLFGSSPTQPASTSPAAGQAAAAQATAPAVTNQPAPQPAPASHAAGAPQPAYDAELAALLRGDPPPPPPPPPRHGLDLSAPRPPWGDDDDALPPLHDGLDGPFGEGGDNQGHMSDGGADGMDLDALPPPGLMAMAMAATIMEQTFEALAAAHAPPDETAETGAPAAAAAPAGRARPRRQANPTRAATRSAQAATQPVEQQQQQPATTAAAAPADASAPARRVTRALSRRLHQSGNNPGAATAAAAGTAASSDAAGTNTGNAAGPSQGRKRRASEQRPSQNSDSSAEAQIQGGAQTRQPSTADTATQDPSRRPGTSRQAGTSQGVTRPGGSQRVSSGGGGGGEAGGGLGAGLMAAGPSGTLPQAQPGSAAQPQPEQRISMRETLRRLTSAAMDGVLPPLPRTDLAPAGARYPRAEDDLPGLPSVPRPGLYRPRYNLYSAAQQQPSTHQPGQPTTNTQQPFRYRPGTVARRILQERRRAARAAAGGAGGGGGDSDDTESDEAPYDGGGGNGGGLGPLGVNDDNRAGDDNDNDNGRHNPFRALRDLLRGGPGGGGPGMGLGPGRDHDNNDNNAYSDDFDDEFPRWQRRQPRSAAAAQRDAAAAAAAAADGGGGAPLGYQCRFSGHTNKLGRGVCFMGPHSEYVVSGSDSGYVHVWGAETGEQVVLLQDPALDCPVHVVQAHPYDLCLAGSGGDDHIVKLWRSSGDPVTLAQSAALAAQARAQPPNPRAMPLAPGARGPWGPPGNVLLAGLLAGFRAAPIVGGPREPREPRFNVSVRDSPPRGRGGGAAAAAGAGRGDPPEARSDVVAPRGRTRAEARAAAAAAGAAVGSEGASAAARGAGAGAAGPSAAPGNASGAETWAARTRRGRRLGANSNEAPSHAPTASQAHLPGTGAPAWAPGTAWAAAEAQAGGQGGASAGQGNAANPGSALADPAVNEIQNEGGVAGPMYEGEEEEEDGAIHAEVEMEIPNPGECAVM